ncbi:MAG: hypothetical protein E7016_07415 [Alphaproteobacteria bacterium]|nr:hypothetical protein [Alphaproteobacteria bacterium]
MLYLKHIPIQSFSDTTVFIHKDCTVYKVDDIKTLTRVEVHGADKPLYAFLSVVDDENIVSVDEIGVNDEAFFKLGLPEGALVTVLQSEVPSSLDNVAKKSQGYILNSNEYISIVNDITSGKYLNADIAAFVTAFCSFATVNEVAYLAQALSFGNKLYWDKENIVTDIHTLGYVPADNTDIIVTAIVAAYGLPILKSVTLNPLAYLGPAHAMQVFANIDIDDILMAQMIKENKGAVFNYETLKCAQAAIKIRNMSRYLNLKNENLEIALMMAQTYGCGISHLVVDVPVGPQALVKTIKDSVTVRKTVEFVAKELGITVDVAVTDGREPIGYGIGALLEAKDIIKILKAKDNASSDLTEKALFIASKIIEFDPKVKGGDGYIIAKEMLESLRALETFDNIVNAQGKLQSADLGTLTRDVLAPNSGEVKSMSNRVLTHIAITAGALSNAGSGVLLMKKNSDKVAKGDVLYRIYSNNSADFALATSIAENTNGFEIGR